ncbi:MAG TPA: energy transducer TonB [Rhodocyclaceae bacterium]|nr:energy transducer TonB [Rhodocyclaceae bacterium]
MFQADLPAEGLFDFTSAAGLSRGLMVAGIHGLAAFMLLAPAEILRPKDDVLLVDFVSASSAAPAPQKLPAMTPPKASSSVKTAPALAPTPASATPSERAPAASTPATPAMPAAATSAATSSTSQSASNADTSAPITEARYDADYLHNPKPAYPTTARRRGEEGRVVLKVLVKPDGSAGDVLLQKSSGHGLLDDAARNTVSRWRFAAAHRGREPVESWVLVPLVFSLDDQG